MGRSEAFRTLRRVIQVALHSRHTTVPARETVERAVEFRRASASGYDRRRFLTGAAGGVASAAFAPLALPIPPVGAAPRKPSGQVAVVGAGLAGLSCADTLAAREIAATLFEASSRVGGRCFSLPGLFPGQVAERGGEFIDTSHTAMRGYANALGLTLEDVAKGPGKVFYFVNGQHHDEAEVVEEFRAFVPAMREDLRRLGQPTADSFTDDDRELDFTSLAEFLDTRGAGPLIRAVVDVAYTTEYGLEISQQSCINFLLFIHADRRSKFHPFGVFSDERFHVVEGNQAIADGLAGRVPGEIRFGHTLVAAGRQSDGRIRLIFTVGGTTVESAWDAVVLAIPFSTLRDVALEASLGLPPAKRQAIDDLTYGTNSKMMIGFDGRPWLTLHGGDGSSFSDLTNHQNTWETNPTRASAKSAILTDYSGGARGASLDPTQTEAEALLFLADLEKVYPGAGAFVPRTPAGQPVRAHLENWSLNPLVQGSYTCNQPGYFTTIAGHEAQPVGNVFFAGEHTSSFYEQQGFMEGAVLSGQRAAREVYQLLRK
jgi:monoamine oxidase